MRPLETRYALALYETLQDEEALSRDVELLTGTPALWSALQNPCVSKREKDRVLCRVLQNNTREELLSFYRLLSQRDRLPLLPAIREKYHQLCLEGAGGIQAEFRCAREPDPKDLQRIGKALEKRRGFGHIEFHVVVDPSLLGGFVIHVGGVTYDKSVAGMLQGLRRSLKERE